MGLQDWAQTFVLGRLLKPLVKPFLAGVEWLNAYPGRKKGVAAILLGFGTSLRVLGLEPDAQALEGFNNIVQGLSTSSDMAGVLMAVWGFVHPLIASHETRMTQAVNVLEKAQAHTPDERTEVKALQATAIDAVKAAQVETVIAKAAEEEAKP